MVSFGACRRGLWLLVGLCAVVVAFTSSDLRTRSAAESEAVLATETLEDVEVDRAANLPRLPSDGDSSTSAHAGQFYLTYNDKDMFVKYGEYSETEVHVGMETSEDDDKNNTDYAVVHWEVVNSQAPPGLEAYLPKAEDDDGRTMYFAGTPEFIGRWCFNLRADINSNPTESSTVSITQMICFEGERNEHNERYEYFRIDKSLDPAVVGNDYGVAIYYTTPSPVAVDILWHNLPEGLTAHDRYKDKPAIWVRGATDMVGTYYINIRSYHDPDVVGDKPIATVHQQIPFHVLKKKEKAPTYYCPEGYYYSESAGACMQEKGEACGDGTYYDATTDKCVPYPTRSYCPIGRYYDPYVGRCVRSGDPRCPYNYRYSWSMGRCVLDDYWCPYGTIRVGWGIFSFCKTPDCPTGYRYSTVRNKCVLKERPCRPGYTWDYGYNQCRRSYRYCERGYHWSYSRQRCVRNDGIRCARNERYDYRRGRCVSVGYARRCAAGEHWSSRHKTCVRNRDRNIPRRRPTVRPRHTSTPRRTVRPPRRTSSPTPTARPSRTSSPRRTVRPPRRTSSPTPTARPSRTSSPRRTVRPPRRTSSPRPSTRPSRTSSPRRTVRPPRSTSRPRSTARPRRTSSPRPTPSRSGSAS